MLGTVVRVIRALIQHAQGSPGNRGLLPRQYLLEPKRFVVCVEVAWIFRAYGSTAVDAILFLVPAVSHRSTRRKAP
jgi:hypothetical protein